MAASCNLNFEFLEPPIDEDNAICPECGGFATYCSWAGIICHWCDNNFKEEEYYEYDEQIQY